MLSLQAVVKLVCGSLLVIACGATAASAQEGPVQITSPPSQSGVPLGGSVTVEGLGCPAGEPVAIRMGDDLLETVVADDAGAFTASVTVPNYEIDDTLENAREFSIAADCGGRSGAAVVVVEDSDQVDPRPGGAVAAGDGSALALEEASTGQAERLALLGAVGAMLAIVAGVSVRRRRLASSEGS